MKPSGRIFFQVMADMPRKPGFLSSGGIAGASAVDAVAATRCTRAGARGRNGSRPPGSVLRPSCAGNAVRAGAAAGIAGSGQ